MAAVTAEQAQAARAAAGAAVRIGPDGVASVRMPRLGSVRHGTGEAALRGCPCLPCDRIRDDWDRGGLVAEPAETAELDLPAALIGQPAADVDADVDQVPEGAGEPAEVTSTEPAAVPAPVTDPAPAPAPAVAVPAAASTPAVPAVTQEIVSSATVSRPVVDEPDLVPLVLPAGLVPDLPKGLDGIAGARARRVVLARCGGDVAAAAELLLMLGLATDPNAAGTAPTPPTPPAQALAELPTAEVA